MNGPGLEITSASIPTPYRVISRNFPVQVNGLLASERTDGDRNTEYQVLASEEWCDVMWRSTLG